LINELIKGDLIKVNFPEGFKLVYPKFWYKDKECFNKIKILPNERMLICEEFMSDIKANKWETISITGVLAPANPGKYYGLSLEHIEEGTNNIFEKVSLSDPIIINLDQTNININPVESVMNEGNYSFFFFI